MLQWLTDLLFKSTILNGKSEGHQTISTDHEPAMHYPFEIIVVPVPKNFIRKLVGYYEKNLAHYRKLYTVDFDYNQRQFTIYIINCTLLNCQAEDLQGLVSLTNK